MEYQLTILNRDDAGVSRLAVVIPDEAAPLVTVYSADGEPRDERDYGNADWPSNEDVAERAARELGYPVAVRFVDAGDNLCEGIYEATRR